MFLIIRSRVSDQQRLRVCPPCTEEWDCCNVLVDTVSNDYIGGLWTRPPGREELGAFRSVCTMKSRFVLACLVLVCFLHDGLSCPAFCKCYSRRAEVVCSMAALSQYPSEGLPQNATQLTIQFTNISSINEEQLNATPLLQMLHLYENRLQNLSSHLLRGVPLLHTLELTGNQLSHLPPDVFAHAPLRNLVLKNNLLREAEADWISKEINLTWLDLSGNLLTRIPTTLLQKLPLLENLDLSNNRLEKISAKSLDSVTKLERLNLQNNQLEVLDASAFQNLHNLTYLFLTRNKLEKLPLNLFQGLTKLEHLSLEDNRLTRIPPGLLDPLDSLEEEGLDLTSNPFHCDENLQYLWRWLQKNKKKVFLPETVTCAKPPSLAGRSLLSLTETELTTRSR